MNLDISHRGRAAITRLRRSLLCGLLAAGAAVSAVAQNQGVAAWTITAPNGKRSLLVPTFHLPFEGLRQVDPSILKQARRLVIEGSPRIGPPALAQAIQDLVAPDVLQALASGRPARADWAGGLSEQDVGELGRNLRCQRPDWAPEKAEEVVRHLLLLRSPRAAVSVAWAPCGPAGQLSRDAQLERDAQAQHLPIDVLEFQPDVERRRESIAPRIYLAQLRDGLKVAQRQQVLRRTVDALNAGDLDRIVQLLGQSSASAEDQALYRRVMLDERNAAWLPRLEGYLLEGKALVGVGAAHLPGPKGLLELLRRAGYRVQRTTLEAAAP